MVNFLLIAGQLLVLAEGLRQIHIGAPKTAREFISQQTKLIDSLNDWWNERQNPQKLSGDSEVFESYPTLIPNLDLSTKGYEETATSTSFGGKRTLTTSAHETTEIIEEYEEDDQARSLEMDSKVAERLLLSGGTADGEYVEYSDQNQGDLPGNHEKKNEKIDKIRSEGTVPKRKHTKVKEEQSFVQNSKSTEDPDDYLMSTTTKKPTTQFQAEVAVDNIPDSENLYLVEDLEEIPIDTFLDDRRTTVPSARIPQKPKFKSRFKLDDPEDVEPEELLIFKRAREKANENRTAMDNDTQKDAIETTTAPIVTTTLPTTHGSFLIDNREINIQRTTLVGGNWEKVGPTSLITTMKPVETTTTTISTTTSKRKRSKKKRKRKKKGKKRKIKVKKDKQSSKIEQLNVENKKAPSEVLNEESSFKVLGAKTYVDGNTNTDPEVTSVEPIATTEHPKTEMRKAQLRKRTIAPYKTQIKQYFVTKGPEEAVELPAIVDKETSTGYSSQQLSAMCAETRTMGRTWGIHDIADFAQRNCPLIRLYYPNVSCGQINQFIGYCDTNHLL